MSRESKLAIGVLLLVVAGLIGYLGSQAPNPAASPTGIAMIFGVPGFLLLLFGILPPRSRRARMVFQPKRLAVGLGVSAAGVATLYLFYQVVHVAPQFVLIGAMLAVPGGLLYAASCWEEAATEQPPTNTSRGAAAVKRGARGQAG